MAIIESRDYTLEQLFKDFYVVRDYQREYVWEEKQVRELLEDVYKQFNINKSGSDWEYFIGSIIVCESQGVYELIDGQQRMTTAYLILCVVRDYRQKIKPQETLDSLKTFIASSHVDQNGNERLRYSVELQYEDSRDVLEKIAKQKNFEKSPDTSSVSRIKNAYKVAWSFFQEQFGEDEAAVQEVKQFYACFIKNVKVVRVETKSVSHALTVFATINNRGVGLNAMDLLKNLMFIQLDSKDFDKLKKEWKEMLDILYKTKEKPLRFLRYFIMAKYDAGERIREDRIYDWFMENKHICKYEENPFDFIENLVKSATAFSYFKSGQDVSGQPNRYLLNMSYFSTTQHLMLLLAAQHLSAELFTELCKQIENFFFVYIVTREGTSKLENLFTQWAVKLHLVNNEITLEKFIKENIQPAKDKLAERFELAFHQLDQSSVPKKIMQYILAKLTQHIDEEAYGSIGAYTELKNYINKKVAIEHILPQKPGKVKFSFDKPDEIDNYIQQLGNLTLLEQSINTSIKNKTFEEKKQVYKKSKMLLTKSIAEQVTIGVNTAVDRAVKDLKTFDEWNSKAIEYRQKMLTELAKKVWNIL
ncbi:MAG: DUF262 domain-containing HNH endonuclease family protein [Brasilonema octagenarum HA4186-MV1]|jgi:uncharacterized protein with ParB-like and HNH nuclease domain|nr:DUF262 domain-containing HNH endonuclease family protein [Brasilonema octagenarum HA4186-MV1]